MTHKHIALAGIFALASILSGCAADNDLETDGDVTREDGEVSTSQDAITSGRCSAYPGWGMSNGSAYFQIYVATPSTCRSVSWTSYSSTGAYVNSGTWNGPSSRAPFTLRFTATGIQPGWMRVSLTSI